MIENIVTWILAITTFLIGYFIGKDKNPLPQDVIKKVKRIAQAFPFKRDIGPVEAPSAEDIRKFKNPLVKAEEEAMKDTFSQILKQ
jgi:hypothetical protein